jgi:hypothetical protein
MIRRYILRLATVEFRLAGQRLDDRVEQWLGLEIDSDEPIDIAEFSRRTGRDLVPCDSMTAAEVASCGVTSFERVGL